MIAVPERLGWWATTPAGAAWLERLPRLARELAAAWELELGLPYRSGAMSLTVRVTRRDGRAAVLKLAGPEDTGEAEALAFWDGRGAVRLLAHDPGRRALLLERCDPGTPLDAVADGEEADRIAAGVLQRLWRSPPGPAAFRALSDAAAEHARRIASDWESLGRPFERELVDAGVAACRDLGAAQREPVLLHGDFHGGNVLRARREAWLAIDPYPLVGEREFDAGSVLRDRSDGRSPAAMRRRIARLAALLDLDADRIRRWGVVNALAWGISAAKLERDMVELARLLVRDATAR
jgi:streptomycin 6-kinase